MGRGKVFKRGVGRLNERRLTMSKNLPDKYRNLVWAKEEREVEKDKRAEEQALLMSYVTSLSDRQWGMVRDLISLWQHHPSVVAIAYKMCEELTEELGENFDRPSPNELH